MSHQSKCSERSLPFERTHILLKFWLLIRCLSFRLSRFTQKQIDILQIKVIETYYKKEKFKWKLRKSTYVLLSSLVVYKNFKKLQKNYQALGRTWAPIEKLFPLPVAAVRMSSFENLSHFRHTWYFRSSWCVAVAIWVLLGSGFPDPLFEQGHCTCFWWKIKWTVGCCVM